MIISMDGVACSGKSTLGKLLSDAISFSFLDTGTIYRLITCRYFEKHPKDKMDDIVEYFLSKENILSFVKNDLSGFDMYFKVIDGKQNVFAFGGKNYTNEIHKEKISIHIPPISKIPEVREFARQIQHKIGKNQNIVIAGRDIGSVVFPEASVEFFITIDPRVRAIRRLKQVSEQFNEKDIEKMIEKLGIRDDADAKREAGPMVIPKGAIVIDNSFDGVEAVLGKMLESIRVKVPSFENSMSH